MVSDLSPPVVVGGIENYILNLSKKLIEQGHEVHWLTSKLPDTKSEEVYEGIKIHRVNIPFSDYYSFPGRQLFSITSLIKGIKLARSMDVIHVNTLVPGFLGWVIAKYSGKPSILFCHEFYGPLWNKIGQNILEKYFYPVLERLSALSPYDWYACPSEYSRQNLIKYGVPNDKITVIKHGIDHDTISPDKNTKNYRETYHITGPTFGYLGRLGIKGTGQAKNVLGLLEAAKYVIQEMPEAKLILGGKGFSDLKKYIEDLGIEGNTIYIENIAREDTSSFLKTCDVVVCPALSDGFCFLLAETSATGVPVIGTNLGSHPERIHDNGMLVNSNPKDIADSILRILRNPEMGKEFGKNGIKFTNDLNWEDSSKEHLKIYERLTHK